MIPTLLDILAALLAGEMTHEEAARYLKVHQELQADVDNVAEDVPYERGVVLMDAIKKMAEQDQRWGAQNYPAFDPQLQLFADTEAVDLAREHGVLSAQTARLRTDSRGEALSWMDLLVEEVAKLTEYRDSKLGLRLQLSDVVGVALQWAQTLVEPPVAQFKYDDVTGTATVVVELQEADHEGPNR